MESLKDSLAAIGDLFNTKMAEFQKELQKSSPSPITTTSLAADFTDFKKFILSALDTIQRQFEFLAREIGRTEMRSRRKMILLHGIPEETTENMSAVVTGLVADKLLVSSFSSCSIARCHRLGRPVEKKVTPVLVKFKEAAIRDRVWFAKTKLKGTGITQSKFLTRSRHAAFLEARRRFGISRCWTNMGVIHILAPDGTLHRMESMVELDALPSAQGLSSPTLPLPTVSQKSIETRRRSPSRTKKPLRK